jgi:amino acid transporter
MHGGKKQTLAAFILSCVLSIAFAIATVKSPNFVFAGFLVASVGVAIFGAYRVFAFSDDWYRAREERERLWYARHPKLTALLVVLTVGGFLWRLFDFVKWLLR